MNYNDWSEARTPRSSADPGQAGYAGPPCIALMGYRGPYPVAEPKAVVFPNEGPREPSPPARRRGRPPGPRAHSACGPSAAEVALRKIREERDTHLRREIANEFNDLMSGVGSR